MHAAVLMTDDQARAFEDPQVLGDRGQRHPVGRGQFGDGGFACGEPGQNAAAGGVGQGRECGVQMV